ncbi:uncharacterized protein TNCV_24672 [Trichonephila clavipes]|uniref:Uncharacterized protein n=1 Tax=Trichonephila clavipes TaxID=2585209 RepID=A0A8X7BC51_TRICX|nr:uncharacterized protein TNCV_24672 [Trichonephila clavipes]
MRTLKQLAMDEANNFPLAAPVVLSDCYMDDILSGSESIEEVIEFQHQLIEMFKTAGMHLHKWCGNLTEMTSNLQEYAFLESDETKALGIIWNPKFIDNCRSKVKKRGPLTTREVNDAETWLIKQDQSSVNLSDPSGGRNLARKTVHTCVVCFKCKPIPSSQIMGNLPYERIKPLAENKGNSGSLEKMEYRFSEYCPTERKVDDREGQCNVWYNDNCKGGFYISLQLAFRARR